ncbi:MAG: EamA family transporter [Actinomycetota bacterium]
MSILLGLGAALTYGAADFFGGLVTKRTSAVSVVIGSQVCGSALLLAALPFFRDAPLRATSLGWGAGAGVAGGIGVLFLYKGLAAGRMSVVAPVTGVVAASVPVLAGLLLGERPSLAALVGVVVALIAVALVSSSPRHESEDVGGESHPEHSGLPEALVAGASFGAFFILLSFAGDDTGLWPLIGARCASLSFMVGVALASRESVRPVAGTWTLVALAGVLDVGANVLYLVATRSGLLSLVAVLTSMYPGATVVLARIVLSERLHRVQLVGLGCAALGVALIAAG